jgi:ribonuclease T1
MIPAWKMRTCAARAAAAFAIAVSMLLGAAAANPALARTTPNALPEVALAELPKEVRDLRASISRGGPFRYSRDGVVFGNRERILPTMPRGYYHEYTVRTPGASDRTARRMVCGGPKTTPEVCYYSDDHYQSFRRIRP